VGFLYTIRRNALSEFTVNVSLLRVSDVAFS
jgi:hypothetical protein